MKDRPCFCLRLKAITHGVFGLIRAIPRGSLRAHNKLVSKWNSEDISNATHTHVHGSAVYSTLLLTSYANANNCVCFQTDGHTLLHSYQNLAFDEIPGNRTRIHWLYVTYLTSSAPTYSSAGVMNISSVIE